MKKLILAFSFVAIAGAASAQCNPDAAVVNLYQPIGVVPLPTDGEIEPDGFYVWPGQLLDQTITILPPQSATVANPLGFPPTITVTINWIRLTNLANAPAWLAYACGGHYNVSDPCQMAYPTWTCVQATSNLPSGRVPHSEVPGTTYVMDVVIDADVSILGTQSGQVGGQLSLIVLDSLTIDVTGVNPACGGNGTASASVNGGFGDPGALVYNWSNGASTQNIANLGPGWYICEVTDQVTGWTAKDSVEIVSPPAINIAVDAQTDEIIGNDGSISITATGGTGTLTYSWSGPGGFTSTSADLTGLDAGLYILTVTDQSGCSSIQSVNIQSQVGIETSEFVAFSIFPNPSEGMMNMNGTNNVGNTAMIHIYDNTGKLVLSESATGSTFVKQIDMTGYASGTYTVELISGSTRSAQQIIIQ
jgi:hypothetical protein